MDGRERAPLFVPETSAALFEWVIGMMRRTPLKVAIDCNRSLVDADLRAEVHDIRVPALVVQGDSWIPGWRAALQSGSPCYSNRHEHPDFAWLAPSTAPRDGLL